MRAPGKPYRFVPRPPCEPCGPGGRRKQPVPPHPFLEETFFSTSEHAPIVDKAHYKRNKKTAWLEFLEALKAWPWKHKDGQTNWTLELDDALRRASPLHPTTTAAGVAKQILHQSILKNALVRSFQTYHPDLFFSALQRLFRQVQAARASGTPWT